MLSNLSIRQKMLLLILGLSVLTYVITFMYIIDSVRDKALEEGKKTAKLVAQKKANEIKVTLDEDMAVARVMAEALVDMTFLPDDERNKRRKEFLDKVLLLYPKYDATWMSWQYEFINDDWDHDYGRERFNSYMENGEVKSSIQLAEMDGSKGSSIYEFIKANADADELLSEPYWFQSYDYGSNTNDSLLAISPVVRMEIDGEFAGIVGSDMSTKDFQSISEVSDYNDAYAVLLSAKGKIIAYKDALYFDKPMDSLKIFTRNQINIQDLIDKQDGYTVLDSQLDTDVYVCFAKIPIARTGSNWTICTVVPVKTIMAPYTSTFTNTLLGLALGLLILAGSILYIAYSITNPLAKSTRLLEDLAEGKLSNQTKLNVRGRDELSKIARSLNRLYETLQIKADFAQTIGEGNLDAKINVNENDELGAALVQMQRSLQTAIGDIKSLIKASESISDNVVHQAENINNTANKGFETSNNGLSLVNNMSESMTAITSIASDTNTSFKILEQRSKEISKVVKVISDLSKQTNLLAINAAIQASRAGEAGKGFAVVANEIRRLAEGSEKSAKEITELVKQMQEDTTGASQMLTEMTESIQKGESATAESSEAFRNISGLVTDTVTLSESILHVAREQINKIKEVSKNTESIVIR